MRTWFVTLQPELFETAATKIKIAMWVAYIRYRIGTRRIRIHNKYIKENKNYITKKIHYITSFWKPNLDYWITDGGNDILKESWCSLTFEYFKKCSGKNATINIKYTEYNREKNKFEKYGQVKY